MRLAGRTDDDVPALDDDRPVADLEGGLARLDDEHLGIRVSMQPRPDTRTRVDEDHAERDLTMLSADELVRVLAVLEVVERDDVTVAAVGVVHPRDGSARVSLGAVGSGHIAR